MRPPGAGADAERLADLLDRLGNRIAAIHVTLDTPQLVDISHPIFWRGANDQPPPPFTQITVADVERGVWRAFNPEHQTRALAYVRALRDNGRYTLTLWPQGSNKDVCRMTINYEIDGEKPIIVGLNIFSFLHKPELVQQRNDFVPATDFKRITNSWEYYTDKESIGLVFLQLKKPDGTPAGKNADLAEVLYSERKF